ncbi:MAG: hypothetical protein MR210_07030 [Erysipelotrichaceae bacterium]|nr:hypothetical protein [Erysipelotrichaceae bacterium]MDY5252173.1 hypothetical protein [Erysipelotrichaceae bacterium]
MIENIINKLAKCPMISDYRIVKTDTTTHEVFYILDKVETVRSTSLNATCMVTIYVDQDDKRGQASFTIHESYDDKQIDAKIEEAIYQSKFSLNTYYPLPQGDKQEFANNSNIVKHFDSDLVFKIAQAVFKANTFADGWISSMEVFVKENQVRIVNSNGVDYTYFTNSIGIEVIPTFKNEKEEIELYEYLDYDNLDFDKITADAHEFLAQANLRNQAQKYQGPNELPILLQAKEIKEIYSNLLDNLSYSTVYNKMDLMKIADKFYGDGDDMPDISLVPYVEGSISNRMVDVDGIILQPQKIVSDNKILQNHGSNQYAYYLGIKQPTGILPNIEVAPGSHALASLQSVPHLACLAFSSFQFDIFSGNFGGEVRLAKYFDGKNYHPVTGLTIGGNIHQLKAHLQFSEEVCNIKGYKGPKACLISKMSVN